MRRPDHKGPAVFFNSGTNRVRSRRDSLTRSRGAFSSYYRWGPAAVGRTAIAIVFHIAERCGI